MRSMPLKVANGFIKADLAEEAVPKPNSERTSQTNSRPVSQAQLLLKQCAELESAGLQEWNELRKTSELEEQKEGF